MVDFKIFSLLVFVFLHGIDSAKLPESQKDTAKIHNNRNGQDLASLPDTRNAMDLIVEANAKSGMIDRLIEGDIMPHRKRNGVNVDAWKWYDHKIAYVIDQSSFSPNEISLIKEAIAQFNHDVSCINFVPRNGDIDYVLIKRGYGCHSSIGRDGGEQAVVLGDNCFYKGVIMHELNHAAGFFHEQSRYDRDKFIQVNWENVQDGKEEDFAKQSPTILSLLGTTYDYGSIMHYGPKTFSKNGNPVLTPRYDPHGLMGQRDGFSKLDVWKLNYMYGCVKGVPPKPEWMTLDETTIITPPPPTKPTPTATTKTMSSSMTTHKTLQTSSKSSPIVTSTTTPQMVKTSATPTTFKASSMSTKKSITSATTISTKPTMATPSTRATTIVLPTVTYPKCIESTSLPPGIAEPPPNFNVAVFPGSLRVFWDRPCTSQQIKAYVLTYTQGSSKQAHQIMIHPNKLTHYISTTYHPGHKYQLSVATLTEKGIGPSSPTIETYSACGNDVTLPENGVYDSIHSPYFSKNYYEPDLACQWTITAPTGQRLKVNFDSLNVFSSEKCENDFIMVNGDKFCKTKPTNNYIYTKGSTAKIVFVSKPGVGNKPGGFKLSVSVDDTKPKHTYISSLPGLIHLSWASPEKHSPDFHYLLKYRLVPEEVEVAIQLASDVTSWTIPTNINFGRLYEIQIAPVNGNEVGKETTYYSRAACERNITVASGGTIYFPHSGNTYAPDTQCQWNLIVQQGHHLTFTFESLYLEQSDGCKNDYVEISGLGQFCSMDQIHGSLESYTDVTSVKFVSDDEEEDRGFRLHYSLMSIYGL